MKRKNITGFTLIELLVVLSVIAVLSTLGYANYRSYSRTKSIDIAKKQIISDLRLAQGWALSGKKPGTGCETLKGYQFKRTGNTSYFIQAVCVNLVSGNLTDVNISVGKDNVSLPVNTQFDTGDVTFKTLGEGTTLSSSVVMIISSSIGEIADTKTVTVSIDGVIE